MAMTTRRSDRALAILNAFHTRTEGQTAFPDDAYWQRKVAAMAERQAVLEDELELLSPTEDEERAARRWFWLEVITFAPPFALIFVCGLIGILTSVDVIPKMFLGQDTYLIGGMLIAPFVWMGVWIMIRAHEAEKNLKRAELRRMTQI